MDFQIQNLSRHCIQWIKALSECIILGFSLMVLVAVIPQETIRTQLGKSVKHTQTVKTASLYDSLHKPHFTAAFMLQLACTMDENRPVQTSLASPLYSLGHYEDDPVKDYEYVVSKGETALNLDSYNRYWHGYLVIIRPLLTFLRLPEIRTLHAVALTLLSLYLVFLTYRQFGWFTALAFAFAFFYTELYFPQSAIHFNLAIIIPLIGGIIVLKHPTLYRSDKSTFIFFVILGACTSFIDFLTIPVFFLAVPLSLVLLRRDEKDIKKQLIPLIGCSAAFGFGYIGMWLAKWILCAAFTDVDVYTQVKGRLKERSILGSCPVVYENVCNYIFWFIAKIASPWKQIIFYALPAIVLAHVTYLYMRFTTAFKQNICYLILMFYPLLWFTFAKQHSMNHTSFTYKAWAVFFLAYMIFTIRVHKKSC